MTATVLKNMVHLILGLATVTTALAQERPNILWITCEDMSARLGCYGDKTVPTPHIDALAAEGIRYTHVFASTGVCGPSRHALITGMYPTSTYAFQMRNLARTSALKEIKDPDTRRFAETRPLYEAVPAPEVRCFTEYLRVAGYYCSNNSKEDYQFRAPVTAWDESSKQAHWRKRRSDQPFFSVFNFTVTHESGIFGRGRSPKLVDPSTVPVPAFYPDTPAVRTDLAKHYDNISVLDKQVGDLMAQLRADGLLDKTIVFFYSDHGDGLPRCKRWVYDSGTRVPLIVRFPDKGGAGTTCDRLVSFVDFGPTVLSLAGVDVPQHVHGRAFLGGQAGEAREHVFFHRDRNGENRETIRAIRDRRYRYVRNVRAHEPYIKPLSYRDRQPIMQELNGLIERDELGPAQWQLSAQAKPLEEFYDTVEDPFEIHNLASDSSYFSKMAALRSKLNAWVEENQDPLDMPEPELVRQRVYPPEGKQPRTADPEIKLDSAGPNQLRLSLTCTTPGACLGFRGRADAAWTIYTEPVQLAAGGVIEVLAHRIGYQPSKALTINLPNTVKE